MAKKEDLATFGKKVVMYGGGGAVLVYGAGMATRGTSWSPQMRGGVAGAVMFAAGFGAASKGHPELGAVLGIAGVISGLAGLAYQQEVSALLAQTDAQRTAQLAAAAGTEAAPQPTAQPTAQPAQGVYDRAPGAPVVQYV